MTDRELLELAAKAAGLTVLRHRMDAPLFKDLLIDARPAFPQVEGWNPLTDDGDALRLAVKTGLRLQMLPLAGGTARVERMLPTWKDYSEPASRDPSAAMRRAIVRAAAEVGKAMP